MEQSPQPVFLFGISVFKGNVLCLEHSQLKRMEKKILVTGTKECSLIIKSDCLKCSWQTDILLSFIVVSVVLAEKI